MCGNVWCMVGGCEGMGKQSNLQSKAKCGGSLVAHQASRAEVPGSNPASTTMILMRCRIIV